jgi:hypothetical protein
MAVKVKLVLPVTPVKPKTHCASKKKTIGSTASLRTLHKVRSAKVLEFGNSKNTRKAYKGHLDRGQRWLAATVAARREAGEGGTCSLGICTDELEKAFQKPPNKYSAMALEMFLVEKCFNQNLSSSYGDGIQGAFAKFWDKM